MQQHLKAIDEFERNWREYFGQPQRRRLIHSAGAIAESRTNWMLLECYRLPMLLWHRLSFVCEEMIDLHRKLVSRTEGRENLLREQLSGIRKNLWYLGEVLLGESQHSGDIKGSRIWLSAALRKRQSPQADDFLRHAACAVVGCSIEDAMLFLEDGVCFLRREQSAAEVRWALGRLTMTKKI